MYLCAPHALKHTSPCLLKVPLLWTGHQGDVHILSFRLLQERNHKVCLKMSFLLYIFSISFFLSFPLSLTFSKWPTCIASCAYCEYVAKCLLALQKVKHYCRHRSSIVFLFCSFSRRFSGVANKREVQTKTHAHWQNKTHTARPKTTQMCFP